MPGGTTYGTLPANDSTIELPMRVAVDHSVGEIRLPTDRVVRRRPTRLMAFVGLGALMLTLIVLAALSAHGASPGETGPAESPDVVPIEGDVPGFLMPSCLQMACTIEVAACSSDLACKGAVSCLFNYATYARSSARVCCVTLPRRVSQTAPSRVSPGGTVVLRRATGHRGSTQQRRLRSAASTTARVCAWTSSGLSLTAV